MWIQIRTPPLSPELARLLGQIPGVKIRSGTLVTAPDHALPIVRELVTPLAVVGPKPNTSPIERIPYLRPWLPGFLTDYQKAGVAHALTAWRASANSGLFCWSAGSGKTAAGVVWACAAGEHARTVVVTKSAVRYQYRDEIERFTEAPAVVLEGQAPQPLPTSGFVVVGYDVLPYWANEFALWHPHSAIFDESQRVKSHKRWAQVLNGEETAFRLRKNQTAAAWRLSRAAQRRLATTATPVRDRVRDLWAQLDLVRPGEFGSYYGPRDQKAGFAWRYCAATNGQYGGIDDSRMSNPDELRARLRFVAHYVPFSIANRELPPKRRIVTLVRVAEQNRASAIAGDLKAAMRAGNPARVQAALVEARLWEAASRKRKRIADLVAQAIEDKQKVVVFTGRRRDCDDLSAEIRGLMSADQSAPVFVGHGGHSDQSRREMQKFYMAAPGPAVLIGTSEAWGEGLNLQDTDLLLVAMLPCTPGQVIQMEGRVARLGQARPVMVHYLVAEGTIDEHVAQILVRKLPAIEKALDSSDEVRGFAQELAGADDETLIAEIAAQIGGA